VEEEVMSKAMDDLIHESIIQPLLPDIPCRYCGTVLKLATRLVRRELELHVASCCTGCNAHSFVTAEIESEVSGEQLLALLLGACDELRQKAGKEQQSS
jgi:hypothetical protein